MTDAALLDRYASAWEIYVKGVDYVHRLFDTYLRYSLSREREKIQQARKCSTKQVLGSSLSFVFGLHVADMGDVM